MIAKTSEHFRRSTNICFASLHWFNKSVPSSNYRSNAAQMRSAFVKRFPNRSNIHFEVAFVNKRVRPDKRDKLLLTDQFSGPLHKDSQYFEGAVSEAHWSLLAQQYLSVGNQHKRSERKASGSHGNTSSLPQPVAIGGTLHSIPLYRASDPLIEAVQKNNRRQEDRWAEKFETP